MSLNAQHRQQTGRKLLANNVGSAYYEIFAARDFIADQAVSVVPNALKSVSIAPSTFVFSTSRRTCELFKFNRLIWLPSILIRSIRPNLSPFSSANLQRPPLDRCCRQAARAARPRGSAEPAAGHRTGFQWTRGRVGARPSILAGRGAHPPRGASLPHGNSTDLDFV